MSLIAKTTDRLTWGRCPQTPEVYRFLSAGMSDQKRGTPTASPAAIPAAGSVARVAPQHCPIPSAQVSSVWKTDGAASTKMQQTAKLSNWHLSQKPATSEAPAPLSI